MTSAAATGTKSVAVNGHPAFERNPSSGPIRFSLSSSSTSDVSNVRPPLAFDVTGETLPLERADALVNINMVHIAPWAACEGLMRGAGRLLAAGAPLYLYGPFRRGGRPTAASNEAFDCGLRAQNAAWGVRDLEAVAEEAARHGLALDEIVEMPSNNFSLVFRKRA